jgi:hypothetical protein
LFFLPIQRKPAKKSTSCWLTLQLLFWTRGKLNCCVKHWFVHGCLNWLIILQVCMFLFDTSFLIEGCTTR